MVRLFTQDTVAKKRRTETIAKAAGVFGPRYTPSTAKRLRLYDEETEEGPPDAIMYWHSPSYVIELVFASDGTIARLLLVPEALSYTRSWDDVPDFVELSPAEMQLLMASSDGLQPLGKTKEVLGAPDGCFQSGRNLYCADSYELASVSHYHTEEEREKGLWQVALRDVEILYKQSVNGIVEDTRTVGKQRHIKVGAQWYHGDQTGRSDFR
jgi:hypothetical protein